MVYKLNSTIDLDVLVAETLEIILSESHPVYFVDKSQQWYNAIIKMDASLIDDIYRETIQLPLWQRIHRCMFNSYGLSVGFYDDNQFNNYLGSVSIDSFILGCTLTSAERPDVWDRILWGEATIMDYFIYFNNSLRKN